MICISIKNTEKMSGKKIRVSVWEVPDSIKYWLICFVTHHGLFWCENKGFCVKQMLFYVISLADNS